MIDHDSWLEIECTDDYLDEEAPEDYDPYDGMCPDEDYYIDDEKNDYIGG